jgi:hypothetical protein
MAIDATNASSFATAAALADSRNGTFTGLITTKRGKVVGGTLYGDDTVHAVIITGFSYMSLVERSLAKLQALSAADLAALVADGREGYDSRKKTANLVALTQADYVAARDALVDSFQKTLAGTNSATTDHVYEALQVLHDDGNLQTVRGARVYRCVANDPAHECKCRDCSGDNRAPKNGQVNLSGLLIGSKVITAAANGPKPAAKSVVATIAKNALRSRLPISRYVSYRLEQGGSWILNAGGAAAAAATNGAVSFNADRVQEALDALVA